MPIHPHGSSAESLTAGVAGGNHDAAPSRRVRLTGWRADAMPISAITAIRDHSRQGLGAAKALIEDCLAGRPARVDARDLPAAQNLVTALAALGFQAELDWDS